MQPPQQPPMGAPMPGPYYGAPPAQAMPMMINKRLIFVILAVGFLLMWIAAIGLRATDIQDPGTIRALFGVYFTGTFMAIAGCILGALGSPRTSDWQNFGLFLLAAFLVLSATIAGIA